jgi:integrase
MLWLNNGVDKMPRYKKKITRLMDYQEFKDRISDLPEMQKAFLSILFFCGCRVSEALALTADKLNCRPETIFIDFYRLKGSKQTDPQEVPRADALKWLCSSYGRIFPFSRVTAWRLVKRVFSDLYPHYFRMNRFTKTLDRFGAVVVVNTYGVSMTTIGSYVGKADIKRVGKALMEELG